ncbi:MAG TPA: MFS transporter [Candidatus Dormibacteraeota bacterium]|nr:MFS transporter [Candidatus Dormibacteraeota bacterium]
MDRRTWTMVAVVLGSGIVFLDGTVVNVALETIGQELPTSFVGRLEGLTYVNSGYLAVLAALLILAGALSDYFGRRRMFRVGLIGFGASSVACGLAPTMELLIGARLMQGAFGALLVPGSLSIITATFSGEERGRAIGLWAALTSAETIVGPLVGGFLVQSVSWRAAFLINVPLVLAALYATSVGVDESRDEQASGDFDWLGAAVIALGVGGLAFGATRGQERDWQDPIAFVALGIGAVATLLVPWLMAVRPHPLIPLSLFRSRNFTVVNLSTFVVYGALYVTLTFQGLFMQGTLGYTPTAAGLIGLPVGLLLTFLSTPAGQLSARLGPRLFLTVGPLLMAAGLLWFARIPSTSEPWLVDLVDPVTLVPPGGFLVDVLPGMLAFGLGISLLVAPLTTALMSSIPVRNAGLGSAINNAISRVGSPLVSAVLFIVIAATFYPSLAAKVPGLDVNAPELRTAVQPLTRPKPTADPAVADAAREASTDAFHLAMLAAALLCAAGAAVNGVGIRNPGPDSGPTEAEPTVAQA